jgi:hypothetical protein
MNVVENNRGAQIASQLNIGEVTSWRLHWLVCDLQSLHTTMQKADFGQSGDLTTGPFARFKEEATKITLQFRRLRWEVKTMLGFDYEDDVDPLFWHLEKYGKYLEEVGNVKDYLERKARKLLEAESERVHESIRNIGQGF